MEIFRYELTNLYAKLKSCTVEEAQQAWYRATRFFDPVFYGIMKYIIAHNKDDIGIIINRNPSGLKVMLGLDSNILVPLIGVL